MKKYQESTVVKNDKVAENIYQLELETKANLDLIEPGQFLNIYFQDPTKIFPRPFSFAGIENDIIVILYKVVGSLTKFMSSWGKGYRVKILYPLGNSFKISSNKHISHIIVGGGIGVAPLIFLKNRMNSMGIRPYFFIGMQNKASHFLPYESDNQLFFSCDDGSMGFKGNVVDCLKKEFDRIPLQKVIYSCGPDNMNKSIAQFGKENNAEVQVSLERLMACGLGLCQGCAIKTANREKGFKYSLVCKDGPVFNAEEICFDD